MKANFFILVISILPAFSNAQQDTSRIVYFDNFFESEPEIQYARFYGTPRKIGNNRYEVVFYTFGGEKFAMGEYLGAKLRNRSGIFVRYNSEGRIIMSASYHNSLMHGIFQRWHANGILADSGRMERNYNIGLWKSWYSNGQLMELKIYRQMKTPRNVAYSRLDGEYLSWHTNGRLKDSGFYKSGYKTGLWVEWSMDGQKALGVYKKGWRQGDWRHYDKEGKFQYIRRYRKNRYDPYGQLIGINN